MTDSRSNFMIRAVEWLRAGYPAGVPRGDYVALLGVLRRKMTEDEVRGIAVDLADRSVLTGDDPISIADIEQMISASLLQEATPEDVIRVSARLASGGWPLADPPEGDRPGPVRPGPAVPVSSCGAPPPAGRRASAGPRSAP